MKINFALVGLAAAQSGDARDYEYDYPSASQEDRWEFSNGVTFATFDSKTTQNVNSGNFVKALKLSCWNSNMIRDMNNDNKFQSYTFTAGTDVEEKNSANWKYAMGDLVTGMNHQYGFEPGYRYPDSTNTDPNKHMYDEFSTTNQTNGSARYTIDVSARVNDSQYGQRDPASTTGFRKWGYNTDFVNRAGSIGFDDNAIQYAFGHADNHDNAANRPYSWDATGSNNMPADFKGYKDDWRFSLRMGGCLYETTNWTYDENSFNKVGRLTYTGDSQFYANIFDQATTTYPSAGSYFADVHWVHVFNAHIFPHRPTGLLSGTNQQDSITAGSGFAKQNFQKTQRDIEDFNVVMANPTYEGHGFLNFVATYHDHVDKNKRSAGTTEVYAGYRFYSTIAGYQNVGGFPTTDCNNLRNDRTDGVGRQSDARCGGAIYENFGDWYLRPPQKYNVSGNAQPYWAYIQPDGFSSSDTLWTPNSQRDQEVTGSRGFAISSFPHNELGKDFRFNIRTLHNMGMGVSKTAQMTTNTGATAGVISRSDAIWSYYMYAVDTIKIAFPEYVARVNHCHFASHKTHPNCVSGATTSGWQDIIVDGVTMKKTLTPDNDSRYAGETNQYGFNKELYEDDPTVATLLFADGDLATFDSSLSGDAATFCDGTAYAVSNIRFAPQGTHGVSEADKPLKPCASWCHPGSQRTDVCGRVLKIENLLQTYDELHMRQYGTIQEVWVQLMYAYQEGFDEGTVGSSSKGAESPFPNIFFSAPEVVGIHADCPNSNFKCRGYMTDEHQPYGGARENNNRVYNNRNSGHTIGAGTNEMHADSVYPANDDTSDSAGK